jgi:hypothetical protein
VLSLGYAKNYIGRTSLQTGPSSKNLWSARQSNLAWGPFPHPGVPTSFQESCYP